mgnify:CR=1 FL=1
MRSICLAAQARSTQVVEISSVHAAAHRLLFSTDMEVITESPAFHRFNPILCSAVSLCFGVFLGASVLPRGASKPSMAALSRPAPRATVAPLVAPELARPAAVPSSPAPSSPPVCTLALAEEEKACPGAALAIVKEGPTQYRINRQLIGCVIAAPSWHGGHLPKIIPSIIDGKQSGTRIYALPPGSFYERLGLQNGDRILRVNGRAITDAGSMLEIYQKERKASTYSIEIERGPKDKTGKPKRLTLSYRLVAR